VNIITTKIDHKLIIIITHYIGTYAIQNDRAHTAPGGGRRNNNSSFGTSNRFSLVRSIPSSDGDSTYVYGKEEVNNN